MTLFKNMRRENRLFSSEWLMMGSIETLFAQFRMFYEKYHANFHPVKEVMAPYWKGKIWDEFETAKEREAYIAQLEDTEAGYTLINEIYQYIMNTRQANHELAESILDQMFEKCDLRCSPKYLDKNLNVFKLKWHFSEFNHLIIDEKTPSKNMKDFRMLAQMFGEIEQKDSEIANKIINLRAFLTN